MPFPVGTGPVQALFGGNVEQVTDFTTKIQKIDDSGRPLMQLGLVLLVASGPEVIKVRIPGPIAAMNIGEPVAVTDLTASPWVMDDGRSGITFRAASIAKVTAPAVARARTTES